MRHRRIWVERAILSAAVVGAAAVMQLSGAGTDPAAQPATSRPAHVLADAVQEAQSPRNVPTTRPEQQVNGHDQSGEFAADVAPPASVAIKSQPQEGKITGFDFYRDPLDAKKPMQTFEETMQKDVADKPKVMAMQEQLLASRYDLTPHLDPEAKMSRGKPLCVGPTAQPGARDWTGTNWPP